MKKLILVSLCAIFIGSSSIYAQKKLNKIEEKDNVTFSYRWKSSKCLKKNSPKILLVKMENDNAYPVSFTFTVDYFWDMVINSSSEEQSFCLKANKSLIGKIKKTGFDSSVFTNDQLNSERFIIEINIDDIKKEDNCGKK